jgi:hypothetical protein
MEVMVKVPPLMPSFKGCVAVSGVCSESAAWTVKLLSPAVAGVPVITPALLNVSPVGRFPLETDQVYVPEPPVAARVALKVVFTVPWVSVVVVMVTGVGGVGGLPPPPLQPARITKVKTANMNVGLNERNLIPTPVSSDRISFLWIVLPGKAQVRELWDHSKQKKFAGCFVMGLVRSAEEKGSAVLPPVSLRAFSDGGQ